MTWASILETDFDIFLLFKMNELLLLTWTCLTLVQYSKYLANRATTTIMFGFTQTTHYMRQGIGLDCITNCFTDSSRKS